MIYTVTLNPALDIIYTADKINKESYTMTNSTYKFPGGKALNVTRMLDNLDIPSIATGFLGGFPGKFIREWFVKEKIESRFIEIEDDTRINIRLRANDEQVTIAGEYPTIDMQQVEDLLFYLSRVREGDIIVMGGSIPNGVDRDIYRRIADLCKANKAEFVVDVGPEELKDLIKFRPLLIKLNLTNLAKIFDVPEISNELDIIKYGNKCIGLGAKNVIVSVGSEGSYLFTEKGEQQRSYGVKGEEVNSFNSRDAMIGGFIGIYMRTQDPIESFKMASAAASATAFTEDLADKELVLEVLEKTIVEEIKLS